MIVTAADAKRIIRAAYGPEFAFRLTKQCTVGVRPVYDPAPMLAWRKLATGKDSVVAIGRMVANGAIDWEYAP